MGIKELKNKYAQSVLGLTWSLLQPLTGLIIISFVFGHILKIQSMGLPYPVFAFPGMLAWYCFSYLMGSSGNSLIESKELIKKISFPKLILPFSKIVSACVEVGIWVILLFGVMLIYGITPSWQIVFFPLFIIMDIILGLTVGIWLSALSFRKKDLLFIIPYMAGFIVLITPVLYPNAIIPTEYDMMKYCNPLTGIVVGFRWSLLGIDELSWKYCFGFIPVIILFISAFFYYRRIEGKLVDVI
jgi:lipopolysaccharide transport system permease protein